MEKMTMTQKLWSWPLLTVDTSRLQNNQQGKMKSCVTITDEDQLATTQCLRNGGGTSRYQVYLLNYVCPRGQDAISVSHHCANTNVSGQAMATVNKIYIRNYYERE